MLTRGPSLPAVVHNPELHSVPGLRFVRDGTQPAVASAIGDGMALQLTPRIPRILDAGLLEEIT